jgi:hypothetical protein
MMFKKSTSQRALVPEAAPSRVGRPSSYEPEMAKIKSRQLRDGSSMIMTPKFAHEYGTASVAFGIASRGHKIERAVVERTIEKIYV